MTGFSIDEIGINQLTSYKFEKSDVLIVPAATAVDLDSSKCLMIDSILRTGINLFYDGTTLLTKVMGIKLLNTKYSITKIRDRQYPVNLLYWTVPAIVNPVDTLKTNCKVLCFNDSLHQAIAIKGIRGQGKYVYYAPLFDPVTDKGYTRFPYLTETFPMSLAFVP